MAKDRTSVDWICCWHWWGYSISQVLSMIKRANLVIGNDSGPAHLAGTIMTPTLVICGPTTVEVFSHDPFVKTISLTINKLVCVGCHFYEKQGFRYHCGVVGCQALLRVTPEQVLEKAEDMLVGCLRD